MRLRIANLHAENYQRLKVVEVTPEGNIVTIAGNNEQGKTSLLDAIYVALKGRAAAPPEPIRQGEEVCLLKLDMGELRVVRKFTRTEDGKDYTDTLTLTDAEGLKFPSPQKVLDALLGDLGFDPFAFVQLKPPEQAKRLLSIAPLEVDLGELAAKDKRAYDTRRDVNRDAKRLEGQLAGMPGGQLREVPDVAKIREELAGAGEHNGLIERRKAQRERFADDLKRDDGRLGELHVRIKELEVEAQALETDLIARQKQIDEAEPLPEPIDTSALAQQLEVAAAIEDHNRAVNARAAVQAEYDTLTKRSEELSAMLKASEKLRTDALAKAKMPVEGLSIVVDDDGQRVTFNGVPFEQASMAQKLRVSTAIAMATNPKLRVLRINDGSLLDDNSMKLLAEMAGEHDFQLFIERVGTGETGIILEDGAIRGQVVESQIEAPKRKPKAEPVTDALKMIDDAKAEVAEITGIKQASLGEHSGAHDPGTGELVDIVDAMAIGQPGAQGLFDEPAITPEEWAALTPARRAFLTKQGKGPTNG